MTTPPPEPSPKSPEPSPRRRGRAVRAARLGGVLALALLVLLIILAGLLYLNRRAAAREVLVGWLDDRGIAAEVEVERIELDGFTGRIRIGDPRNPDVTVERVEVDYVIAAPWRGMGVQARRIRLVRPVARLTWTNGELGFGALDPLIEEFTSRPPQPEARGPLVLVEDGRVRLTTDYGYVEVLGDARVDDGKLMRLAARVPRADLRSGVLEALALHGDIDLATTGDRVAVTLNLASDALNLAGARAQGARLRMTGDLPYPDLARRRGDGRAVLDADLSAGRVTAEGLDARAVEADLGFDGQTAGWMEAFSVQGSSRLAVRADSLGGAIRARDAVLDAPTGRLSLSRADDFRWRLDTPATLTAAQIGAGEAILRDVSLRGSALTLGGRGSAFEASGPLSLSAARFQFGELRLDRTRGDLTLDAVVEGVTRIDVDGALTSSGGAWPLFGPRASDDLPELAAMKAALGDFAVTGVRFDAEFGSRGTRVVLDAPAVITPRNGGVLTLYPVQTPVFAADPGRLGGGAMRVGARRGAGLPEAEIQVPRWRLTGDGFSADLSGRAALDFGLARGIDLTTAGTLTSGGERLTYTARGCTDFTVERLELDENDVTDVAGALCPTNVPLATVRDGAWNARGRLQGVLAQAPFLQLSISEGAGILAVDGGPRGVDMDVGVERALVADAAPEGRFNPVIATGSAALVSERWTGTFDLARNAYPLGRLTLAHDGPAERGGMTVSAPAVAFAPGALQPADLSPLAAEWMKPPVTGTAAFEGRFDWAAPDIATSSGVVSTTGLDFVSPAGPVRGLQGIIEFTSLVPLVTAPGQTLRIAAADAVAPLENVELTFGLDEASVRFDGATVNLAGGRVTIEPFDLPLDRTQPFSGVLTLDRVQLGEIVAGSGFADKVVMDAVVSGRLPFTSHPTDGVRITGGTLYAVQPGRLSINRAALVGLEAGGGGEGVPPNTVQDLAYQAMENLAFDILSADVNSMDQGRLGVLFRIKGRHDPPQLQELRLTIPELISQEFLNRPLPLPSGTEIDLTLDTTLNINQLIADILEINRARQGLPAADASAAPPPSTPEP